jgi:hypothetical protein
MTSNQVILDELKKDIEHYDKIFHMFNEELQKYKLKIEASLDSIGQKTRFGQLDDLQENSNVSDTVLKPKTFEEVDELSKSVTRYYHRRISSRVEELQEYQLAWENFDKTGTQNSEILSRHLQRNSWILYFDLLKQYCDDVTDLFESRGEK